MQNRRTQKPLGAENRTQTTLVEGNFSPHCATPAPRKSHSLIPPTISDMRLGLFLPTYYTTDVLHETFVNQTS